ncbi:restriction endonuclease subunit S [Vibrio cholerae]|uniref:restriction endonuclease subunit S n=1 Tax=Vibrio cholerae TaxID=666 RepID=UPI0034DAAAE0
MASNWKTYSLGDIADIGSSKRIKMADYVSKGVPFFRSKEIIEKHKGNAISTELFITEEQFSSIKAKFSAPCEGDILLTSVGTLGVPYQVQCDDRFYFKDGNLTWFRNFKDVVNSRYIYFWLTSALAKRKIDEVTIGSTQQALTIVALKSITIDLPPISIQNAIIKHIDSISRKITLNRQINQTLEQMAQALFKSWFVDFDPVIDNALDAGNPIPDELQHRAEARKTVRESEGFKPLPDDVRQLFPDAFEESELGWVPKGWGSGCLADIASYTSNRVATTKLSLNNYVSTENMLAEKKGIVEAASLPTVNTVPAYTTGNVLISNIRPYFKKIWMANGEGGHSNDVLGFAAKEQNTEGYLFNLLYQDALFEFMMTTAKGSKMPRGDKKAILGWQLVIPPCELREYFSQRVADFYVSSSKRTEENKTLSKLRDTLLPKLISGELRLDEVELAVEQEAVSTEQQNER